MLWKELKFKMILFVGIFIFIGCFLIVSPVFASSKESSYISGVKDALFQVAWGTISWSATTPASTAVTMEVRGGNTATPDGTWSSWINISNRGSLSDFNGDRSWLS